MKTRVTVTFARWDEPALMFCGQILGKTQIKEDNNNLKWLIIWRIMVVTVNING